MPAVRVLLEHRCLSYPRVGGLILIALRSCTRQSVCLFDWLTDRLPIPCVQGSVLPELCYPLPGRAPHTQPPPDLVQQPGSCHNRVIGAVVHRDAAVPVHRSLHRHGVRCACRCRDCYQYIDHCSATPSARVPFTCVMEIDWSVIGSRCSVSCGSSDIALLHSIATPAKLRLGASYGRAAISLVYG